MEQAAGSGCLAVSTSAPNTAVVGPATGSNSRAYISCTSLLWEREVGRDESAVYSDFKQAQRLLWPYPSASNLFAPR
jgi:hypothetical protein